MPSAFTHAYAGVAVGSILAGNAMPPRFWILAALCGLLPDIDALGWYRGVRYGSAWGHRGMTHSILFAAVAGIVVAAAAFSDLPFGARWLWLAFTFFMITISHALLDAITDGGLGVALFAPFNRRRIFFRWRPVKVSPMGVRAFFTRWGVEVMKSEIVWIWAPLALLAVVAAAMRGM